MYDTKPFDDTVVNMLYSGSKYSSSYMYYGHLLSMCKVVFRTDIPSPAGVSFEHTQFVLHINPEQFNKYPLHHRLGILKHEMLHILGNHFDRFETFDKEKANVAADCSINQFIEADHLADGAVTLTNFPAKPKADMSSFQSAEHYYNQIDDSKMPAKAPDHSTWGECVGDPEHRQAVAARIGEKATEATHKARGNMPGEVAVLLELLNKPAQVDWRNVLRNIVGNKKTSSRATILRKNRRLPDRPEIKGRTKDRTFGLLVVSDVSGSVSDKALRSLWGEILHICSAVKVLPTLIQVDTQAYKPEPLTRNTTALTRKANGGTVISPAIDIAKEHNVDFQAVVVTTDGYLDNDDVSAFEALNLPIIWLIESAGRIMPSMEFGRMRAFKLEE